MADESVYSHYDAERLCREDACDYINIKFSKSGGIAEALRIDAVAAEFGIPCMIGGMLESRLALAAKVHFAYAAKTVRFYDLDTCMVGHLEDPVIGGVHYDGYRISDDIPETEKIPFERKCKAEDIILLISMGLRDDSGLEIEAINNEPVYNSEPLPRSRDMNVILIAFFEKLADSENRKARFRTVISLFLNEQQHFFECYHRTNLFLKGEEPKDSALLREIPNSFWIIRLKSKLQSAHKFDSKVLEEAVNYTINFRQNTSLASSAMPIAEFKIPEKTRVYYFDTKEYVRYFDPKLRLQMIPGDVVDIPEYPAIVKSRPIAGDNNNAVLLNLDKIRHFNFIRDDIPFRNKKDRLIGRFAAYQQHRKRFFELYFGHQLCDLGSVVIDNDHPEWYRNDVATNLKWIMSSNSVAVMPLPKYETWFMEGKLNSGFPITYRLKTINSDMEEKLHYYINHASGSRKNC
ncbi:hypothetical protein FQR65_LT15769 [Abscondita terminalis]|nr:hypothetical protein FQR65_LT15769 [Abscondita terminalis]